MGFLKGFLGAKPIEFYASGTDSTYAYAINSSDEVVGEYFDSSNVRARLLPQCRRQNH